MGDKDHAQPGDHFIVRLPSRACSEPDAICIDGEPLSDTASTTVPGQPFTAEFAQVPTGHDGVTPFDLHLHFSHEPAQGFSYRTVPGLCAIQAA